MPATKAQKSKLKPRKSPKQERARRTVEAILQAAAQVFEQQGFARATTDRIAERAGCSIGSLYQYFPSKDSILVALAGQHADEGLRRVRELLAAAGGVSGLARVPVADILRRFIEELIELHQREPWLHRMLFLETPVPLDQHAELAPMEDELGREIAGLLRQHPQVQTSQPEIAAWMLVHATSSLVHDFIVHPPPGLERRGDFIDQLVRMLSAYLVAG